MDYQKFIFGLFLLIIPLIILVLFYKNYVYNYCKNDISCLKDKLINNLNTLGKKINNKQQKEESEETEHFAGISDWFMGSSTPNQLPISSSTNLEEQSLTALEKKIADRARVSTTFPPSDGIPNSAGPMRAYSETIIPDNKEFLAQIENKPYLKDINSGITKKNDFHPLVDKAVDGASQIPNKLQQELPPATPSIPTKVIIPKPDAKLSPFGKCNFFNDKCPDDHHPLGNFSIGGLGNNTMLQCGQVQNGKNGAAVALLRNNSIHDIHITDQGHGYNPSSPPKVIIEGGKGTGAKAEAIVDDNGFLKVINVKNPGYNYVDTPIITIESPYINSSCHLCCKNE
jgi:hypothetical protein